MFGHVFPVWLKFKGGKGVATYIGVLIAVSWPVAAAFGVIWGAVAALTRYSSLSGLIASAATPVLLWFFVGRKPRCAVCDPHRAGLDHAPRQHRAAPAPAPNQRSAASHHGPLPTPDRFGLGARSSVDLGLARWAIAWRRRAAGSVTLAADEFTKAYV